MSVDNILMQPARPATRSELQAWIREALQLPLAVEQELLRAVDTVLTRQERLWQESKNEAIHALSAGFAEQMARVRTELSAKDSTVSSIASYFEQLVAELTERTHRDPKTKLMNFARFMEQLESFLALEQRGRWCAVGLVDITGFKWYNDSLGHAVGDRIIDGVARILRQQIRSDDIIAQERRGDPRARDLHARFGGDEFCFLIPDLAEASEACMIAERFRDAVERHDWTKEDGRLAVVQPVKADVGVVCLWMGQLAERRPLAKRLAAELIQCADQLMYNAKEERASHVFPLLVRLEGDRLVEVANRETPA